jgi:hypothetical protein
LTWARTSRYQRAAGSTKPRSLTQELGKHAVEVRIAMFTSLFGTSTSLQERTRTALTLGAVFRTSLPLPAYQSSKKWRRGWWAFPSRSCPQVCGIETSSTRGSRSRAVCPKARSITLCGPAFPWPKLGLCIRRAGAIDLKLKPRLRDQTITARPLPAKGTTLHPRKLYLCSFP